MFTISVKSKVFFQRHSEITWPTVDGSGAWFPLLWQGKVNYDWFLHEGLFHYWLIFLLYLLQSVCCEKYSAKATHFSILNLLKRRILKHHTAKSKPTNNKLKEKNCFTLKIYNNTSCKTTKRFGKKLEEHFYWHHGS